MKEFYNRILADRKPYFFRYKYKTLDKELREYVKKNDEVAQIRFCKTLKQLLEAYDKENNEKSLGNLLTAEEEQFIMYYKRFFPVIDSPCVMNKICKHIEAMDFNTKKKVRSNQDFNYRLLQSSSFTMNQRLYEKIKDTVEETVKKWNLETLDAKKKKIEKTIDGGNQSKTDKELRYASLLEDLEEITSSDEQLANYMVYLFYEDRPSLNKNILWTICGRQIYENIKSKTDSFYFPIKEQNGDLEFLYQKYSVRKISLEEYKDTETDAETNAEANVKVQQEEPCENANIQGDGNVND